MCHFVKGILLDYKACFVELNLSDSFFGNMLHWRAKRTLGGEVDGKLCIATYANIWLFVDICVHISIEVSAVHS